MALYSIKQETLTDIGDALRRRHGETEWITVTETQPVIDEVFKSRNMTGFGEFNGQYLTDGSGSIYMTDMTIQNVIGGQSIVKYWVSGYMYFTIYEGQDTTGNKLLDINASNTEPIEGEIIVNSDYFYLKASSVNNSQAIGHYAGIIKCDAEGNPTGTQEVEVEKEVKKTFKSSEMAQAIDDIPAAPPESAFVISGDCKYKFAGNGWNWFLDTYKDRISTENITSLQQMFDSNSNIESINFDFNCRANTVCSVSNMFNNCRNLKAINGKIKNLKVSDMDSMFNNCQNLRYLPEFIDIDFTNIINSSSEDCTNAFYSCYSLRSISESFLKQIYQPKNTGYYYSFLYNTFYECFALDEIRGLNPQTGKMTSSMFNRIFDYCLRIKNIIFAKQEDGTPYTVNWKNQTVNLTSYVGYTSSNYSILNYNSGITSDKEVKDDATYQALKNDPDWFATNIAYSRYNHDSAVATINSLPDTSAYLASAGGTNTIKFKGEAGSATDGGAINTLTSQEIAVAAAKGWTVTFA